MLQWPPSPGGSGGSEDGSIALLGKQNSTKPKIGRMITVCVYIYILHIHIYIYISIIYTSNFEIILGFIVEELLEWLMVYYCFRHLSKNDHTCEWLSVLVVSSVELNHPK